MRDRRWDTDERGNGIGDAHAFVAGLSELADAMQASDWVAEDADAHLLPHLRRACQPLGLELVDAVTTADAVYEVRVAVADREKRIGETRAAIFALIGSIAESATYVRQRRHDSGEVVFEVVTGMLASDSAFRSHGHTLRIHVVDAPAA
jgi:hypothetical protein